MNNSFFGKDGRYPLKNVTLEVIDRAVVDYFDKKLNITVESEIDRKKAKVMFATGERWKLTREDLRDENGTLILPLISIKRTNIDRTPGNSAMSQEVPYISVKSKTHEKTPNMENIYSSQKRLGFPVTKKPSIQEYFTIPFPDFCTVFYEIIIWTQFQSQMNEILEKIFYNYDYLDSFVMWSEYDEKTKKGDGYRFVGFRDGNVSPQTNVEEFSDQERIIKYSYTIKVPAYLILDPKDETLAYGRNKTNSRTDDNSKVVYKNQNLVGVKLTEKTIDAQTFQKLEEAQIDLLTQQQDKKINEIINLLSSEKGGSSVSSLTLASSAPPSITPSTNVLGTSLRAAHEDHTHAHDQQPGGNLHPVVSPLSAGFVPTLTSDQGYILTITGNSASWQPTLLDVTRFN